MLTSSQRTVSRPFNLRRITGGRRLSHPRESTAFNAKRYKWVKKAMERSDVVPGHGETIVCDIGTLYGEWPDGTPFKATVLSTGSSCVAEKSFRWMSGTIARNAY